MPPANHSPLATLVRNARLWVTVLWATTLALGITGWDWAESWFAASASREHLVLWPQAPLSEASRQEWLSKTRQDPAVLSARWLSPGEVRQAVEGGLPTAGWSDRFGRDSAWFPELLDVTLRDPLGSPAGAGNLIGSMTNSADWLALWDSEHVAELRRNRDALRILLPGWLGLTFLIGAFALARLPLPPQGRMLFLVAGSLLGAAAPLAIALGVSQADLPAFTSQSLLIAAVAGLLLAGGVATMLRLREPALGDPSLPQVRRALDYSIQEASDERNW